MTAEERIIAMKTSRGAGASAINKDGTIRAIVPIFVEKNIEKGKSILDFGAGKNCTSTKYLLGKGFDVTAYDLWCGEGDDLLDSQALDRKYDCVFASNVLNVQSSLQMLFETLQQIYNSLEPGGEFITNYPASPRKMILSAQDVSTMIKNLFNNEVERVGGTKSAPLWIVTKPFGN